jgi:tryptophan 7-halogenase
MPIKTPVPVKTIVIAGGGLAGWMAASALSRRIPRQLINVMVIENGGSDDSLGPFVPALATLPSARQFHGQFSYGEDAIVTATAGGFSLGTAISGWTRSGKAAFHSYGDTGANMGHVSFHHLAARLRSDSVAVNLADYALAALCAQTNRFVRPLPDDRSVRSTLDYGLVLDAERYCQMFKQDAVANGVASISAVITGAVTSAGRSVTAIETNAGAVTADFFIDCTGLSATIISALPDDQFENWSHWLPCDYVESNSSPSQDAAPPYAHLAAHVAGWRGFTSTMGVQHETMIFHAASMPEQPGKAIVYQAGRRSTQWQGNVLALGAAAILIEPGSPLSLHLLQSAIQQFVTLLPTTKEGRVESAQFNEVMSAQQNCARDFAIMPYKLNGCTGSPFWDRCRAMTVPDTLQHKIALYSATGRLALYEGEAMAEADWIAYFDAQDVYPARYDPAANAIPFDQIKQHFARIRHLMVGELAQIPFHAAYLQSMRR